MITFKQVTFVPINPNCTSLKVIRYNIDTLCDDIAERKAQLLISKEEHANRYKLLHIIDCKLYHAY